MSRYGAVNLSRYATVNLSHYATINLSRYGVTNLSHNDTITFSMLPFTCLTRLPLKCLSHPQTAHRGDGLQILYAAAKILNKESWIVEEGWSSSLRVGRAANNSSV
jgi:hypothetical protein